MVGLQSLAPGQAPMPGQAQMAGQPAMPGMMPRQQGTPQGVSAFVPSLVGLGMDQLLQMFADPNNPVPKNRLLAAMTEKQKEMAARQAVQGQMAMAQAQQQPGTVKDQIVQSAMQGAAQGYAGGGAVAFDRGGAVQHFKDGSDENGIQSFMSRFPEDSGARRLYEWIKAGRPRLEKPILDTLLQKEQEVAAQTAASTDTGDELSRMLGRAPAPAPMAMRDTRGVTPGTVAAARQLGAGQDTGSRMQAATTAAPMGLPALAPEDQAFFKSQGETAQRLANEKAALIEKLSATSPEVQASRETLKRVLGSAYDPQKKTLQEAQDLYSRGIWDNSEALGRMAAALNAPGLRRLGQGLGAAAGAAAEFQGEQRKRIQDLQDKYNALQSQLSITLAQAQHADIVGDDERKRKALQDAQAVKAELFATQNALHKEASGERYQQAQGIASLQKAQADLIQAGKPDAATAMLRAYAKNPELVKSFFSAQTEGKAKNPFDMINDNAQRLYSDWLKSTGGMTATEAQRAAMWQQIFDQQIAAAARFGVKVPEAGAAPAKGTKDDPIKLG